MKIKPGTEVRIYRNLTKNCFSIQAKTKAGWRVVAHQTEVYLQNVRFQVYESGRKKVLKTGVKNVHAFVIGYVFHPNRYCTRPIRYDPYHYSEFWDVGADEPIFNSAYVTLRDNKIYSSG